VRISLWRRDDLIVTDPDRVLAAGRARYRETWPDDDWPVERRVPDVAGAISVLLTCEDCFPLEEEGELGLVRAGSVTEVLRVERVLGEWPDTEWPEESFDRSVTLED
jgi:hypothetical protein